jgi:hypothetical protein
MQVRAALSSTIYRKVSSSLWRIRILCVICPDATVTKTVDLVNLVIAVKYPSLGTYSLSLLFARKDNWTHCQSTIS